MVNRTVHKALPEVGDGVKGSVGGRWHGSGVEVWGGKSGGGGLGMVWIRSGVYRCHSIDMLPKLAASFLIY